MCTHNQCFRAKKKKNIILFHLKINISTAVKYCCNIAWACLGIVVKTDHAMSHVTRKAF